MMSTATFRARFPEFRTAADDLVQTILDEAALRVDAQAWGAKLDVAHGYLAAHLLASSPYGKSLRLEGAEERYLSLLDELRAETVPGILVLGAPWLA